MPTLRNVNLNLLPVLHALAHHRSVTRAGEALNISQSAVSDACRFLWNRQTVSAWCHAGLPSECSSIRGSSSGTCRFSRRP